MERNVLYELTFEWKFPCTKAIAICLVFYRATQLAILANGMTVCL